MAEIKKSVFDTLNAINVNEHVEKKKTGERNPDGTEKTLSYLSWVWAWGQVKQKYPDANYEVKHWDGKPYLADENLGYMVETSVTIDDETMTMWLPVMDSKNKAMKSAPYSYKTRYGEKEVAQATMFDINTAIMRCLVKNLAMFGLGLYIYAGEDLPEEEARAAKDAEQSREELEKCWRKYSKVVPTHEGSAFMTVLKAAAEKYPKQQ